MLVIFITIIIVVLRKPVISITLGWTFSKILEYKLAAAVLHPCLCCGLKVCDQGTRCAKEIGTSLWVVWENIHFKDLKSEKINNKDILEFVAESIGETSWFLGAGERKEIFILLNIIAGELSCYNSAFSTRWEKQNQNLPMPWMFSERCESDGVPWSQFVASLCFLLEFSEFLLYSQRPVNTVLAHHSQLRHMFPSGNFHQLLNKWYNSSAVISQPLMSSPLTQPFSSLESCIFYSSINSQI